MMPRYPEDGSYTSDTCSCSCSSSSANNAVAGSAVTEGSRDNGALDFTRAFIYLRDLRVPKEFLDGEISHVTIPAEQLYRLRRHPHRGLGREQLGHAGVQRDVLAGVLPRRGAMGQGPGRLGAGRHVGELELHRLEVADGLAELLALGGELETMLDRPSCNPYPLSPNPKPAGIESFHGI